jgi:hypothetical protein
VRDAKTASIDGRVRTAAVRVFGFANPRFQTFDRARSIGAIEGSGRRPPRRIARRDKGARSTSATLDLTLPPKPRKPGSARADRTPPSLFASHHDSARCFPHHAPSETTCPNTENFG